MKPLLCVRHQETAPLGVVEEVLDAERVRWTYLDVWAPHELPDPRDISGLVVLGGEANVDDLDGYPYLGDLRDFSRTVVDAGMPVLGVCLGAQMLTRAFGAAVTPMPVKEIGFHEIRAVREPSEVGIFAPFAPSALAFQFHEDACALPDGAELLFEGDIAPIQAYRMGERAYAAQFHLEVTRAEIAAWSDEVPDLLSTWGTTKALLLEQATEHLEAQQHAGRESTRRFLSLLSSSRKA